MKAPKPPPTPIPPPLPPWSPPLPQTPTVKMVQVNRDPKLIEAALLANCVSGWTYTGCIESYLSPQFNTQDANGWMLIFQKEA
jgi:hypothetical protein